jgi:predicted flap endonuclease-1-like 5' DNA nuclease
MEGGGRHMSLRVLFALFIGILLAGAGLVLLIWLLWRLWILEERKKESRLVELELEPEPTREPDSPGRERFSPAMEEVPPVPPPAVEPAAVPPAVPAVDEPAGVALPAEEAPSAPALGDDVAPSPVDFIVEEPAAQVPLPGAADDLKLIEGIGPKIASVLREAGIDTFEDLAASDVDRLATILREADPRLLRLADPGTWPEQARLAAAGEWDALTELQGSLRGGRRVR